MAASPCEKTCSSSRPSKTDSQKLLHITYCPGFYINAYYKSQRRAAMLWMAQYILRNVLVGIFIYWWSNSSCQESLYCFSPSPPWYAIKQDIRGKKSSCHKAKWKPGVHTQPPTPSASCRHHLHVNVAGKELLPTRCFLDGPMNLFYFQCLCWVFGRGSLSNGDAGEHTLHPWKARLVHTYPITTHSHGGCMAMWNELLNSHEQHDMLGLFAFYGPMAANDCLLVIFNTHRG